MVFLSSKAEKFKSRYFKISSLNQFVQLVYPSARVCLIKLTWCTLSIYILYKFGKLNKHIVVQPINSKQFSKF